MRLRPSIGSKLLLIILPCMLVGAIVMFLAFEQFVRAERIAELQARLHAFVFTQAASLVKPVGEVDGDTLSRLFDGYGELPELLAAELHDAGGTLVARAGGRQILEYGETFTREMPVTRQTPRGPLTVGRLVVTFHDGLIRADMAQQRRIALAVLSAAFGLLAVATLLAVRWLVVVPLGHLRDSLRHNAAAETRHPLAVRTDDELGEVMSAYNHLLGEIDQRSRDIHHLAYHDQLTGLPNRRLLEDRLGHALAVVERQGRSVAVLFADIDKLKVVNDTLGHKVGDELIRIVASRLTAATRSMDTVARWGGDEFVVVIENVASPGEASSISEKIIEAVGQPISLGNNLLRVGISLGISLFPEDGRDVTALIKNADMALFEAKMRGRNAFHFFDQAMNTRALRRLEIEMALRQAIQHAQLELHYQPKMGTASGRMAGVEALVRWRRPGEGLVPPDQFIPIAEESDLIIAIGDWVLREACAQIQRWRAKGMGDIHVAVNISARHFRRPEDVEAIIAVVDASGVPPHLIEIELTESLLLHDPERVVAHLKRLREKGFGIAIDDFGTGYSNLSYLRGLPITTLKIDRSFVTDVEQDEDGAEIIRTIVAMANTLKLGLVAEGVETEGQLAFLRSCCCDVVQGFYFARPMPAAEIEAFVKASE
jgi:diguanylate cyclase (GGDEF)-like protein